MASFNKVILIGHLTADPELKTTTNGTEVTQFTIGVNRRFAKDTTDFINIVAWKQTAKFVCNFFKKGKPILVCGEIQTRNYTDKDGNKRYVTEVVADEVGFVESAENSSGGATTRNGRVNTPPAFSSAENAKFEEVTDDDNLPF